MTVFDFMNFIKKKKKSIQIFDAMYSCKYHFCLQMSLHVCEFLFTNFES